MPKAKSISYEFEGSDDLKSAKDDDEAQKKQVAAVVVANDKQLAFENHFEKQYGMHFDSNLKTRLQSNAIAAYSSLGEISIGKKKYGRALKFLKIALLSLGNSVCFNKVGVLFISFNPISLVVIQHILFLFIVYLHLYCLSYEFIPLLDLLLIAIFDVTFIY